MNRNWWWTAHPAAH
ncbi:trp operon leader peptide [Streptomyces sp. NPDC001219]